MFMVQMWRWWYGPGWGEAARAVAGYLRRIGLGFSVSSLLRTLFAPWRQTINVAGANTPLQVRLQWWLGNQISRFIGLLIRLGTLLTAALLWMVAAALGAFLLAGWMLVPPGFAAAVLIGLIRLWS